jgi:hypothetical protein
MGHNAKSMELKIYDATGRMVSSFRPSPCALRTTQIWHGRDDQDRLLPSGVYFVELQTEAIILTEKVIIVR